ncbi:MAG: hypothetical protein WAW37_19305 [Syntrophobacteraceae bacterium]
MAKITKRLLILSLAALLLLSLDALSLAGKGPSDARQDLSGSFMRLAASAAQGRQYSGRDDAGAGGRGPAQSIDPGLFMEFEGPRDSGARSARDRELDLRDEFMNNPPFSTSAQPPAGTTGYRTPSTVAPAQVDRGRVPSAPAPSRAPQAEMEVVGYAIDPTGTIQVMDMNGVLLTVDGSRPVRLVFPPDYGLAPVVLGGASGRAGNAPTPSLQLPPPGRLPVQIFVREYWTEQDGSIFLIGMDGIIRAFDGSRPVKLVFSREDGRAPVVVGGGRSTVPASGSGTDAQGQDAGGSDFSSGVKQGIQDGIQQGIQDGIQQGIGTLFQKPSKGQGRRSGRD